MDIIHRIVREPAALTGLVSAVIGLGLIFGWWQLTKVETGALMGLLGAVILAMRAYVTPISSPTLPIGTRVNVDSSQPTGVVTAESEG